MKRVLFLISLIAVTFAGFSQAPAKLPLGLGAKGSRVKVADQMSIDSALLLPKDTIKLLLADTGAVAYKNGVIYVWKHKGGSQVAWEDSRIKIYTPARVIITDANGIPITSTITSTELSYLSGASSSLQTQISAKLSNITSLISSGTNVSITGTGTVGDPYVINSSGGAGGITSINSQTGSAITLATGTIGTDFTISPSSNTITFNIPTASASNRGLLSTTDWSTFNGKQPTGNYVTGGTGDVVFTGPGSVAATIQSNVVTNAKAAQMAAHTFKGNNTGSMANASDITATQLTAELNVFGPGVKGLVPSAAGSPSSSKYLSEDGTFSTPSGGTPGGSNTQIQFNNSSAFAGDAGLTYNSTTNKITTDSIRSIKNTPDTVHIGTFQGDKADTAYFFGTSITAGTAATSAASRYTKIVADGLRVAEANYGLGGYLLQKSPGWGLTNTFKDVYTSYVPIKLPGRKYIFLAWGENDATQDYAYHTLLGVDTSYFKRDYVIVINYAVSQGWSLSDIRIISPFYQSTAACPLQIQQNYYDAAKHIADSMGISFIDVFNQGKNYDDFIRVDYIHPSNYGHALAGNAILKQLTQPLQIQTGENLVNSGKTVLNDVKFFGKDTATAGYQLAGFNTDESMVRVPSEVFVKVDNTNVPVQSGNISVLGNITAAKAIRPQGLPTYSTGHGFEVYYDDGKGWLVPYDRDASSSGNIMMPFSSLVVASSTPGNPFSKLYVNGLGFAQGLMSSGNGNIGYNSNTNEVTLNMLVSGDSVGHVVTFGPSGVGGYYRTAINGIGTAPVVIGKLSDDGSGARLQVNGNATVTDEAYNATTWNGNFAVPTKNAIRDKIESLSSGSSFFLDKQYTTTQNSGTSTTNIYTYTIPANTFTTDGDIVDFETAGFLVDATTTPELVMQFNGSDLLGTGVITIPGTVHYRITGRIIRTSSTTARATTIIHLGDGTGKEDVGNASYSSLDFTSGIVLRLLGTASGAGASTGDILGHFWTVEFKR